VTVPDSHTVGGMIVLSFVRILPLVTLLDGHTVGGWDDHVITCDDPLSADCPGWPSCGWVEWSCDYCGDLLSADHPG
jgi:hypothetical protein